MTTMRKKSGVSPLTQDSPSLDRRGKKGTRAVSTFVGVFVCPPPPKVIFALALTLLLTSMVLHLKNQCNWSQVVESIQSPLFQKAQLKTQTSTEKRKYLLGALALAKIEFWLSTPYAQALPTNLNRCEQDLDTSSKGKPLYDNIIIPQKYLEAMLPLKTPEDITNSLIQSPTGKKSKIIDIGANKGQFAIPLAQDGHEVFSFEPVNTTCAVLKENLDKYKNAHVFCVGIAAQEDVTTFGYVGQEVPTPSYKIIDPLTPGAVVKSTVRVGPVQSFLTEEDLTNIRLFKTDTQGFEEAVLRGAANMLDRSKNSKRPRFVTVEYSDVLLRLAGTNPRAILEIIYEYGYVCTHLTYHHIIKLPLVYSAVDTPSLVTSGPTTSFDEIVKSIGKHNNWRLLEKRLEMGVQGKGGWTDLFCVS